MLGFVVVFLRLDNAIQNSQFDFRAVAEDVLKQAYLIYAYIYIYI